MSERKPKASLTGWFKVQEDNVQSGLFVYFKVEKGLLRKEAMEQYIAIGYDAIHDVMSAHWRIINFDGEEHYFFISARPSAGLVAEFRDLMARLAQAEGKGSAGMNVAMGVALLELSRVTMAMINELRRLSSEAASRAAKEDKGGKEGGGAP
ncbi:hypothetical protein, partial [Acidilobus sp.]|uniref:hypothetical protein n=1 Tax=Acidilobus sp. TaxID=1872109 RepID=UPI003CFF5100